MSDAPLPAGKKKYRATFRKGDSNPFRGKGLMPAHDVQEVEVDADIPLEQVKTWARAMAVDGGVLVSVEEIK